MVKISLKVVVCIFSMLLLGGSCLIIQRKKFSYYHDRPKMDRMIRIGGYYYTLLNDYDKPYVKPIFLYQDGYAFLSPIFEGMMPTEIDSAMRSGYERKWGNFIESWGLYRINGDTIKIQDPVFSSAPPFVGWYDVIEWHGKITSDTSFRIFGVKEDGRFKKQDITYKFQAFQPKPDSINWMMFDKKMNKKKR